MNPDTIFDHLRDQDAGRVAVTGVVSGMDAPGDAWRRRDPRRTTIEGALRSEALLLRAVLDVMGEDVQEARAEGVSWEAIGTALDMPAETVALAYGAETGH